MKKMLIVATLVVALVSGLVAYAVAAGDSGTVTVTARVRPVIQLTINTPTLAFGDVLPGDAATLAAAYNVRSNDSFTISKSLTSGTQADLGLTTAGTPGGTQAKAPGAPGRNYSEDYSIDIPWTTDPGDYTIVYTYNVVTTTP